MYFYCKFLFLGKLLDVTYLVGLRIGEDMARTHMTSLSSAFFSAFDKVYDQEGKALTSDEEQDALKGSADLNFPTISYLKISSSG